MVSERKALNTLVSPTSHEGWGAFARSHGTTVTALIEVLGCYLADPPDDTSLQLPDDVVTHLIARAREVDYERRHSRGRRPAV